MTSTHSGAPSGTHAGRRERLAALLPAHEADAILVTRAVNVRYLTGLVSSNAAVLVTADGTAVLATDSRYAEAARALCEGIEVVEQRDVAGVLVARAPGSPSRPTTCPSPTTSASASDRERT
nr:hypothetical protein GCM10020093_114840 [Planobispora longispora]